MANNVIDITQRIEHRKQEEINARPHFNVLAMCLECCSQWIGTVDAEVSLFRLECYKCKECNSFASFIPPDYMEQFRE